MPRFSKFARLSILLVLIVLIPTCVRMNVLSHEAKQKFLTCERKYLNRKTNNRVCNPIGYEEQEH